VSLVDEENGRVFTRHAEATWPELFFDIFFVANLTTFTAAQEIDDPDCMFEYPFLLALYLTVFITALQAYIGFFAILWFTWLQASLFDLRFGKDSFIQRAGKIVQVAVMVGFAAINSKFYPTETQKYVICCFIIQSLC